MEDKKSDADLFMEDLTQQVAGKEEEIYYTAKQQPTYGKAINYVNSLRHDFQRTYNADLVDQCYGLYNTACDKVLDRLYREMKRVRIDNHD